MRGLRAMADHVATTKNKGMLTRTCQTILSFVGMAMAKGGEGGEVRRIEYQSMSSVGRYLGHTVKVQ